MSVNKVCMGSLSKKGATMCWQNRCYKRGTSLLGWFNTIVGCLTNRVLVKRVDRDSGQIVGWFWGKATDFPSVEENSNE